MYVSRSSGLHDGTCPADGDVGAKGGGWELGYGVVGDPFAGGAAGFGGAVVFYSLNDAALRTDDEGPRARRVHGFVDPTCRLLGLLHLFVDFLVMQEGACPVCRQD